MSTFLETIGKIYLKLNGPKHNHSGLMSFDIAKTIGIIYQREDLLVETTIERLFDSLEKLKKNIYSLEYIPEGTDKEYRLKEKNHYSLRKEDINLLKLPKKGIVENFCSHDFDILINFCQSNHIFIENIVLLCNAKFKVGTIDNDSELYDFIVNPLNTKDFKNLVAFVMLNLEKIVKH